MLVSKFLQIIDKNPDNFKDWGCQFNCIKIPVIVKIFLLVDMLVINHIIQPNKPVHLIGNKYEKYT